jgi:hypothetical protein
MRPVGDPSLYPLLTDYLLVTGLVKYLYLDTEYLDEEEEVHDASVKKKRGGKKRNKKPTISDDVIKLRCLRTLLGTLLARRRPDSLGLTAPGISSSKGLHQVAHFGGLHAGHCNNGAIWRDPGLVRAHCVPATRLSLMFHPR